MFTQYFVSIDLHSPFPLYTDSLCAWLDSATYALSEPTSLPEAVTHQSPLQALTMYVIAAGPACQLAAPRRSWGPHPRT